MDHIARTTDDLRKILDDLDKASEKIMNCKSTKELAEADYARLMVARGLQIGVVAVNREIGKKVLARRASLRYED